MPQESQGREREKLEQALAALEAQRPLLGDEVVDSSIAALKEKIAALGEGDLPEQQRKQVTVLFMDVVGSTNIVRELDPEDYLAIMDSALRRMTLPITRHGGRVTRYTGDGFKAVFGHPVAHENDPDMAVLAGLEIVKEAQAQAQEVREAWGLSGFNVRVGVSTGLAVIGGGQSEAEDTLVGTTVNLAARLESAAPPGGLVISHATYQHVRGAFDLQPLEPIQAKGFLEPVPIYLVLRAKARSFRTRRRGVEGVETRMVGRELEYLQLQKAFREVVDTGDRQMVTVVGEAGVGKSRLLYEFENWVDLQPHAVLLYRGRAREETLRQPYSLWRDLFAYRFSIQDDDTAQAVREKVLLGFQEILGTDGAVELKADIVGNLLGYDFKDSQHLKEIQDDPQQIRDRSLLYLTDYFKTAASRGTVLMLLEDLHWADDSSLDTLARLALALRGQQVLILGAARPGLYDRRPSWMEGHTFHLPLNLRPLSMRDCQLLVDEVLQKVEDTPPVLRELVVGNSEGNPFYVEELIKMLCEEGAIIKGEPHWRVQLEKLHEIHVPATLTGVLQSRLEGLPLEERGILQQASVVGRVFWDRVLAHLNRLDESGLDETAIEGWLTDLRVKEMIYRRDLSAFAGANEHIFKHTLLREVAYESVLKRVRRAYHSRVAEWLMNQIGERTGEYTGLIAAHLEQGGKDQEAIAYLMRAGEQAAAKYANGEAIEYFSRALALAVEADLETCYQLRREREKVLDLQGQRDAQLQDLKALENLAKRLGDPGKQMEATLRWANYYEVTGDYPAATEAAESLVALARHLGETRLAARGQLIWGRAMWRQGHMEAALERISQAIEGFRTIGDRLSEGRTLRSLGIVASDQGNHEQAQEYFEQSLEIARETGDRLGEIYALNNLGVVASGQGDNVTAQRYYAQVLEIARETGDRSGEVVALYNLGYVVDDLGDYATAQDYYEQALTIARETADRWGEAVGLSNLGWVSGAQENFADGQRYFEDAFAIARATSYRLGEGVALTGLGTSHEGLELWAEAIHAYEQAIEVWEELGMMQLKAESQAGWARVESAQGARQQALRLVEEVMAYLVGGGTVNGTHQPLRIHLTCFQVLQEAGDPRATGLLEKAYHDLQERAAKITLPGLKRSFLENVPWHREIGACYQEMKKEIGA